MMTMLKVSALVFALLLGAVSCTTQEEIKTAAEIKQMLSKSQLHGILATARVPTMLIEQEAGAANGARTADLAGRLRFAMPVTYRMTW